MILLLACTLDPAVEDGASDRLTDHMGRHGTHLADTRDAVIAGRLDLAVALGQALVASPRIEGLPERAQSLQAAFFFRAEAIARATDLFEAGRAVGMTAQACGDCHAALSGGPDPQASAVPSAGGALAGEMGRHAWAVERMWTGLLLDEPAVLAEGLSALEMSPLVPSGLPATSSLPAELAQLEVSIHDLAAAAVRASEAGTDAGAPYGEMLAMCATCHAATGGGPDR